MLIFILDKSRNQSRSPKDNENYESRRNLLNKDEDKRSNKEVNINLTKKVNFNQIAENVLEKVGKFLKHSAV